MKKKTKKNNKQEIPLETDNEDLDKERELVMKRLRDLGYF
jgi:hypothetical protein